MRGAAREASREIFGDRARMKKSEPVTAWPGELAVWMRSEAIIARGSFGYSPTPGTKPVYN